MGNAKLRISAKIDLDLAPIKAFTSTGSLHGATSKHLKGHLGPYLSDEKVSVCHEKIPLPYLGPPVGDEKCLFVTKKRDVKRENHRVYLPN